MSRIGRLPVTIPDKVTVTIKGQTVTVQGPKGTLSQSFHRCVSVKEEDKQIIVSQADRSRLARAMQGTARSIIANMVNGVVEGYSKNLEIVGVGFRASVQGDVVDLSLGYSHPVRHKIPEGISVTVADNTKVKVEGIDKQKVGQLAAAIRAYYPAEPYKGKGVRIAGEFVRRKEGKKTA